MSQISSVQLLSCVRLFAIPWTAACQASLSITNSWSLLKLLSLESVMPSNHLILCRPLLFLPSNFPSIRVFSNESALRIRWPKYWHFSFSISPSNEYSGLISCRMDWLDLLAVQGTLSPFGKYPGLSLVLTSCLLIRRCPEMMQSKQLHTWNWLGHEDFIRKTWIYDFSGLDEAWFCEKARVMK